MKKQILYVELKTGYNDNGPAWIGIGFFSKTGRTVYFNGKAFRKVKGISGNYLEIENSDEYWISGIKKDGSNRHWAGSGIIQIDNGVVTEYLKLTGQNALPKNKFKVVQLDNSPSILKLNQIENQKLED